MRRNGRQNTNECWVGRRRANSRTEPASDPIREPSGGEGRRFPNTSVRSRLRLTIRKAANDFVQQSKWHWPLAPPFFLAADAKHIAATHARSEEHTSEFQSRLHFVCRLLLEKKTHIL